MRAPKFLRNLKVREANDVFDVMLPVFIISKILGLAPFMYNSVKRTYKPHIGLVTIIRFVLVVGTMCYVCFVMDEINFSVNMGGMALRYELYFGTIMTAVVLVMAQTNQKLVIGVIQRIEEVDRDMKTIGLNITYKHAQIFAFAQIFLTTFLFFCKATLQPFSINLAYFVIYSIFNVVDYVNTSMLFQYVDVLLLIRQRFVWINRKLREMSSTFVNDTNDNVIVVRSCENDDNVSIGGRQRLIVNLGKIHNKLYIICKLANRAYGAQLLVTITLRFIMITTQLINTYKLIQDPSLADSVTHSIVAIYLFLHGAKIFMVAALSDNTATRGRETGVYLHGMWDCTSEENEKVQTFSLQVLHQDLYFSACGFFKIDYTLIYNIVGAVTTYLVILIQFDLSRVEKLQLLQAARNQNQSFFD